MEFDETGQRLSLSTKNLKSFLGCFPVMIQRWTASWVSPFSTCLQPPTIIEHIWLPGLSTLLVGLIVVGRKASQTEPVSPSRNEPIIVPPMVLEKNDACHLLTAILEKGPTRFKIWTLYPALCLSLVSPCHTINQSISQTNYTLGFTYLPSSLTILLVVAGCGNSSEMQQSNS